jgi:uncharacterized protein DUF6582
VVDTNPARGMPLQLQRYWLVGKGAAKIRWDTPNDFYRCVAELGKYFPKDPKGLCNILHRKATGAAPGHGPAESLIKVHHSIDTVESLTAAATLAAQPATGGQWVAKLAPIGKPTGEPTSYRQFEAGSLAHRSLPLPMQWRRVNAPGHQGGVVVGRINGITYGPDEAGNECMWGWGDWFDPDVVPEVKEAKYLADMGVLGHSLDPGGRVIGAMNPDTGGTHMQQYVAGGTTLVPIPAFSDMRIYGVDAEGNWDDEKGDMGGDYDALYDDQPPAMTASADKDCGCDGSFTVNPPGWRGLPLAARESVFDNDDAVKRIGAWAGLGTAQPDVSKMKRAFMWSDPSLPPTDPTAYRLPVGDIINGKLTLMFHAIYAAAALISGAHGGLPSIPDNEKNQIRKEITNIYQSMAQDFGDSSIRAPWDRPMDQNQGASFAMADNPNQPYGDVAYADPGYQGDKKKRYPIDTEEHVRSAWAYINKDSNASKYNPEQLKSIKDKIMAAAKKLGIDIAQATQASAQANGYSVPLEPPGWWFEDPMLPGKTAFTVEPDGRVYGHLAAWGECHRDVTNRECVLAPHSRKDYEPFHLGQVMTAEGKLIKVGKVVQDTRHAGINLSYAAAAIHYDHTGDEAAVVRAGEDEYGIWVAGAVVPDATPRKVAKLRRSPLSGDWRRVEGNLELTAALAVNVPAFPVYSMEGTDQMALTAAGTVLPEPEDFMDVQPVDEVDDVYAAIMELAAQQDAEDPQQDEEREWLKQWYSDLVEDQKIYEQRARTAQFAALAAAPTAPGAAPAPAPAAANPAASAAAPTDPNVQQPAPTPADTTPDPMADNQQQALARQWNASFNVLQFPDGSTPSNDAPGTSQPKPGAPQPGQQAPAQQAAPAAQQAPPAQ